MEASNTAITLLDYIEQPAICVRDGVVLRVNPAADRRQICVGTPIADLLTDSTLCDSLPSQVQSCTINVNGISYSATVIPLENDHLILLETDNTQSQLQSLALAAQHFRTPLGGAMALTEMLLNNTSIREDSQALSQAAQLNRGLNQLQRMVCDMSDTWQYTNLNSVRKVTVEIGSVFDEIMEKVKTLLEKVNIQLNYTGLSQPLICRVDTQMLERAVYNLISNSVKFSDKDCSVAAKLIQRGEMLHFSVSNRSKAHSDSLQGNMFSQFLREPGVDGGILGIGLGMMLIRSVATAHGGTVLYDRPDETENRVTMTLKIDTDNRGTVSAPTLGRIDYAGGRDHALLELSDILPSELYDPLKY